ncbi:MULTISPECIES: 6-phospho-3-hexuloisomerase [unclassified Archaeoglobus]|jgi:6-phospho-3-hexuloisomerase|uniref:6-phospho-3-hexuloisomerase n=1 Tax=unclassified Archaeoglobus TaxID=2643606 RepID=UPI0025B80371|nr:MULTISPECIES: 6-phospho-3-hexuloisomerase [unclassified Archaeoglobus]
MAGETLLKFLDVVSEHIRNLKNHINPESVENVINLIDSSKAIFVIGAGRSGYIAKAFAMRLMHLGYAVYVVGETVTPRITKDDTLIAISGSGETTSVVNISRKAKDIGSRLIAITGSRKSSLAEMADVIVLIKGKVKDERDEKLSQLAPLGTMFELTTMIFLDALVAEIMMRKHLTESDLEARHAVLE